MMFDQLQAGVKSLIVTLFGSGTGVASCAGTCASPTT